MRERQRRKSRTRRSCCQYSLFAFLFLVIVTCGIVYWFYSHPISSSALHQRVVTRLERISGLDVEYDSATFTVSTGQYRITNLRFTDPATGGAPVLTVGDVYARIHPWQILSDREAMLTEVVLKNPSQLDLLYSEDSIRLGNRSQFLVDSVKNAQPPGTANRGGLPFHDLRIENVDMTLSEAEGILPGLSTPPPAMVLTGDLKVSNESDGALAFDFDGNVERPNFAADPGTSTTVASGVKAALVMDGEKIKTLEAEAKRVSLTHVFRATPDTALKGENLKVAMDLKQEGSRRSIHGTFGASGLAYVSPENNLELRDSNLAITADFDLDTSQGRTVVRTLDLKSNGANAVLSGSASYKEETQYDAIIAADSLSKDYRVLIERLLPPGWDVQAGNNSFVINMHVTGGGQGISNLDGKVSVRGVHLLTPALPAALKNLHGDIQFKPEDIRFVDMTGEYAGARVALDGTFKGDIWKSREGALQANWSTIIPLADVLKLHGNQFADNEASISGEGSIRGNGTWSQQINLMDATKSSVPSVDGEIDFVNVGFKHNALPAPIAGLNGTTRIVGNRLVIDNLSGNMQGNQLDVVGEIIGDKYFWRDPQVSASLQSRLDLNSIGPYLTDAQQAALASYKVSGKAETELLLRGPLSNLASGFTGHVNVSDLGFSPNLDFLKGRFSNVNGLVTWDGQVMKLENLTGQLEGEALELDGSISADEIKLTVNSSPNLKTVEAILPRLDKYLDMSGQLDCDLTLSFKGGSEKGSSKTLSLTQMLESARKVADQSVANKTFSFNGNLSFQDASIRHIAMPPARKEHGRSIPAGRVTDLNGTVNVVNDTLSVSDSNRLTCSFADTPNCKVGGSITFRQDNFPSMKVRISTGELLKLDTWALGWGKELDKPDTPPMTGKKFDLDAEITAPTVEFRGQQVGRSMAKFSFNMTQDDTPRVTNFREVVLQGDRPGMGRLIGNGTIESFVWNERDFPRWKTSLDVQTMPLETMLAAVFNEPANIRGMITGNLNIRGVGANSRSIRGQGSGRMQNLELGGTAVIRELGQSTGRNFGGTLFETAQAATFNVGNGALSSRDLALQTNGLQLDMRGDYYFAGDPARNIAPKTIDGVLRLRLFKSVFGSIPIIGQVADLADEVTNAFLLAFRVTGSASQPRVTPVALPVFQGAA